MFIYLNAQEVTKRKGYDILAPEERHFTNNFCER